jgi:hypothetical protein
MIEYTKKNKQGQIIDDKGEVIVPSGKGNYFQTEDAFIIFETEEEKEQFYASLPQPDPGEAVKTIEEEFAELKQKVVKMETKVDAHDEYIKEKPPTK